MNKFKICPYCGTRNDPKAFDCSNCDGDISSVKITDEESAAASQSADMLDEPKEAPVRICSECGHANPVTSRKCEQCGEDISDIAPIILGESKVKEKDPIDAKYVLFSIYGDYAYEIMDDEIVIGRESGMKEYMSSHAFVSRRHCRFSIKNDGLFIEDVGSSNGTYVNNKKINAPTLLKNEDELGIGGCVVNGSRQEQAAYFVIRMNECTSQESCTQ